MNKKIVLALIVLIAVASSSVVFAAEASKISIDSADVLKNGDEFHATLTGADNSPIANETINITVIDAKGEQSNVSMVTVDNGDAALTLDGLTPGQYTFNCTFYGNDKYSESNAAQLLTVEA